MRQLLVVLFLLLAITAGRAEPPGQRFVSIGFHDIVDDRAGLDSDAVTTKTLVQFFDWLKGTGWNVLSLDDLAVVASGVRPLPDKAILITFDDGYRNLYTRAFPLLRAYHYPAVAALVGSWMEDRPDGTVQFGDKAVPRSNFISWAEAREMEASGLVEFASHSYDLHRGVRANPQGNVIPGAITWKYDPIIRTYEDDAQYTARIRADLTRSRAVMAANLGHPPRAMVWPYGRYTGPALAVTKQLGFRFSLTLEPEPAYTSDLFAIHRYFPTENASLADIVRNLRFEPDRPLTRRIACLTLDALAAAAGGSAQDEALGRIIENLRALGANTVVIDANAALPSSGSRLGAVFFPTRLRPLQADLLSRAVWQIRTRGGASTYVHLPLAATVAAVGDSGAAGLFADMARYTAADGVVIDMQPPPGPAEIADALPGEIRARRQVLNLATFDTQAKLGFAVYGAAAAIDPRLRLMLAMNKPAGPPAWTDIGLLPPSADAEQMASLAAQFRAQGWLRPTAAGRTAFSLPIAPDEQAAAIRLAQRQGASAFALCPEPQAEPPGTTLSATFSAATYPHRP
jgi:peptidoglycan/xylan/chitin deacetylase (PgdA/CDA1 family)